MRVAIAHNAVTEASTPDERDVLTQVKAVSRALIDLGHEAIPIACDLDLATFKRGIERIKPGCVFNLVESLDGRGQLIGLVPFLLDAMGIVYTGAPAASIHLTSHKVTAKQKMRAAGLPTPKWIGPIPHELCSRYATDPTLPWPRGPWMIKSVWEHASLGLSGDGFISAENPEDLIERLHLQAAELGGACFAEMYIDGREFNLSLLSGPDGPVVLPPAEIVFDGYQDNKPRIVCYSAKWDETSFEYSHTPRRFDFPQADEHLLTTLKQLAIRCWQVFGLRGYARVDFRIDNDGHPFILEINTNPCLSPDAGFAAAVDRSGTAFDLAVKSILKDAFGRKEPVPLGGSACDPSPVSVSDPGFRYEPEPRDVENVRHIIKTTGFFQPYEVDVAVELVLERLSKGPASDYYFVFLDTDDRLAGYACYGPVPCTASSYDIYWIAVDPALQRRGIGNVILNETERLIREAGGTRVYVDTSSSETYDRTRAFYQKCGYGFASILEDFYAPGDGKVVCCKSLISQ